MGATFAYLLVRDGGGDGAGIAGEVAQRIRARISAAGYREAAALCDREIVIGNAGARGWVRVDDSALSAGDAGSLDELGTLLAHDGRALALGVSVYDGDVLELRLFREGAVRARLSNWPGYFGGAPRPAVADVDDPDAWDGAAPGLGAALADPALWRAPFAETPLRRIAEFVGAGAGSSEPEPGGLRLCFAANELAASASVPRFVSTGGSQQARVRVGASETVSIIAHNAGAPSHGLSAVAWGPALDRGLVDVGDAALHVGARHRDALTPTSSDASAAPAMRTATFAQAEFPSGPRTPGEAFAGREARSGHDAWMQARVEVALTLLGRAPGSAELHLGLVALAAPDAAQTSWTVDVTVVP